MRSLFRATALLCGLATLAHAQTTPAPFPGDSALRVLLQQRVAEQRSPGVVVGLLEADGRTRIVAAGDAGPGRLPLDGNSVFEIGSITKLFTATLLADLARTGAVRLEDPAQRYLPAGVALPRHDGRDITLASLSEQNSGLPYMPGNLRPSNARNPFADYTVPRMYEFLASVQLPRAPGAQFEYSNLGVGLLGHVLSRAAGQPYETLVRERITAPLGMTHTGVALSPWMREHLVTGHDAGGAAVDNWDFDALAAAGALRSTASDMLRFADAALHPERGTLPSTIRDAQRGRAEGPPGMRIGLNWMRLPAAGDTIVWHNGGTGGYRTFLGMLPGRRVAVVVLTNSGNPLAADDLGFHLLNPAVPLAPTPRRHTEIPMGTSELARYVGTYRFTPAFAIAVTLEGDALWAQATGQPRLRLWPEADAAFFLKEVDAQLTFTRDANGAVSGLVLHQGGLDQPAPRGAPPAP